MNRPPAFQFYADDFLAGTFDMSIEDVGAYIRLLCHQWNRGSIPVEPDKQNRLAGGLVSDDVRIKFKLCDGVLKNERLEIERKKQDDFRRKQAEKGVKSGISRREQRLNRGSTKVEPSHEPETNSPSPSPSPSTRGGNGASLSRMALMEEIFSVWNSYGTLPKCLLISDKRRRSLQIRLQEPFFSSHWKSAIDKVSKSNFCCGESEKGWKATFDWFITPDAVTKIMEGKYDNRTSQISKPNPRNIGVAKAGISYGEAARRLQEKQALARQVAQVENQTTPATVGA